MKVGCIYQTKLHFLFAKLNELGVEQQRDHFTQLLAHAFFCHM